jgi:hypothetical protein
LLNHRLQAGTPCGVRMCGGGIPAVSLVPSSTAGYRLSSLRDEVGEGREPCGEMVAGGDGGDRADRADRADGAESWDQRDFTASLRLEARATLV